MIRSTPGESLDSQSWISRTRSSHDGSPENAKVGSFMRKAPTVHDVCLSVFAHPRTSVRVSTESNRTQRQFVGCDGASFAQPLISLLLHEQDRTLLTILKTDGKAADGISERIFYFGIQVEKMIFEGQRRDLRPHRRPACCIFFHESFPGGSPPWNLAEG